MAVCFPAELAARLGFLYAIDSRSTFAYPSIDREAALAAFRGNAEICEFFPSAAQGTRAGAAPTNASSTYRFPARRRRGNHSISGRPRQLSERSEAGRESMPKRPGLYIGTSGWNYFDWKGRFYPESLKPAEYLLYFSRHFPTTEVNYSFYHLPKITTYEKWVTQVPDSFVFALKASRTISHIQRLKDVEGSWTRFLENAAALGGKLGPVLVQLPPSLKADPGRLEHFLSLRPGAVEAGRVRLAFEFRHSSWFEDKTFEILAEHEACLVIAHSQRYARAPMELTAPFVYLRFHGPRELFGSEYSREQLSEWAGRIRKWLEGGRSVYAYFNNDFHGYATANARLLTSLLE